MFNLTESSRSALVIGLITLAIFLLAIAYILYERAKFKKLLQEFQSAQESLMGLGAYSVDNIAQLEQLAQDLTWPELSAVLTDMVGQSQASYNRRWLPDPSLFLTRQNLIQDRQLSRIVSAESYFILGLGFLASSGLFIWATFKQIAPSWLAMFPLLASAMMALILTSYRRQNNLLVDQELAKLASCIGRSVPVYSNHSGVALLVDSLLDHDYAMQESLDRFSETTKKLVEGDFVEGMTKAVRDVMEEEIAPPIKEASQALYDLSHDLADRQANDMAKLSTIFAQEVGVSLANQLSPLADEMSDFNQMIAQTRGFIQDSVAILETSRQQNIELNQTIYESLESLANTKVQVGQDLADIREHIAVLADVVEHTSKIYRGEQTGLQMQIKGLTQALQEALSSLDTSLQTAANTVELAGKLETEQGENKQAIIAGLQKVADNINQAELNFNQAQNDFIAASDGFVKEKLEGFDQALAEVVERLIFTASAIRDAVDTLPMALRQDLDR